MSGQRLAWTDETLAAPHEVKDKAQRVRTMFNDIAPRYELINTLFSLGLDRLWRRKAVKMAKIGPCDQVLDIASGTGDLARAFFRAGPQLVVGADFAHAMLVRAAGRARGPQHWCESDALALPFKDTCFDVVSCAFGIRNFQDLDRGLHEMARVLRSGGRAIIIEFTVPRNPVVRWVHGVYARGFMPIAASLISGDQSGAYRYLPKSVVSFVSGEELVDRLRSAGFDRVERVSMTAGMISIYAAWRK